MNKLRRIRYKVLGQGNECNKCGEKMERRAHNQNPNKNYFFTEWDFCKNNNCKMTVQHYEEFKSSEWKESERQESFFNSLK